MAGAQCYNNTSKKQQSPPFPCFVYMFCRNWRFCLVGGWKGKWCFPIPFGFFLSNYLCFSAIWWNAVRQNMTNHHFYISSVFNSMFFYLYIFCFVFPFGFLIDCMEDSHCWTTKFKNTKEHVGRTWNFDSFDILNSQ